MSTLNPTGSIQSLLLITLFGACLTVAPLPASAQTEFDLVGTLGDRAYYVSDTEMTWAAAVEVCAAEGGHLVTIADAAENELVRLASGAVGGADVWIGFTDEMDEGDWVWVDGSPVEYTNWADYGDAFEPDNNGGVEHFGLMWGESFGDPANRGAWADVAADVHAFAVLERSLPTLQIEATTLGPNEVRLDWTTIGPAPETIRIERKEGLYGAWELVQTVLGSTTAFTDGTVTIGIDYIYRLKFQDGPLISGPSNYATTNPGFVPSAPTNIFGDIITPSHVRLFWQENAVDEIGYLVQRKAGEFGTWQNTAPQPAGSWRYDDTVAYPEEDFQYRVSAYNQHGKSAWATTTVISTPSDTTNFDAGIWVLNGKTPCNQANVYLNRNDGNGFVHVGNTDAIGYLFVDSLGIADRLRAIWYAKTWPNCRDYQSDASYTMGMHLRLDSDIGPDVMGNYRSVRIDSVAAGYTLQVKHPVFVYDLALSIGRNIAAGDSLWTQLYEGCQQASDYLYDASDGQMALGRMLIYDNWLSWEDVDVQVKQGDFNAHTECNQYNDCDDFSEDEHIHIPGASGVPPNHPSSIWPSTLIHEFGHYGLDLKDEYENGWGSTDALKKLKDTKQHLYPQNYGVMDRQFSSDEFSSFNDYTFAYDYGPCGGWGCGLIITEQLYERGRPCWEQIETRHENYSSLVDFVPPPTGWYINGSSSSNDRVAPFSYWDDVEAQVINGVPDPTANYPKVTFETIDGGDGPVSFLTDVLVADERGPVPEARVYRRGSRGIEPLGRTDDRGRLGRIALEPGDEIVSYGRGPRGTIRADHGPVTADKAGGELRLESLRSMAKNATDVTAPGAAVDLLVHGPSDAPWLELLLWFDEPLMGDPEVMAFHGSHAEPLPVLWIPDENRYHCELGLDMDDPFFDGQGVFEVSAADAIGNGTVFTADFTLHETRSGEHLEIYQGSAVLNVPGQGILAEGQPAVSVSSNSMPYGVTGSGLLPVGGQYGVHLAVDDVFLHETGFNVQYADSLLEGIDETTLVMFRWDAAGRVWVPFGESGVTTTVNTVSGYVTEGGLFAVFATGESGDLIPPGGMDDLGAIGVEGPGTAHLFWTAPGDDDDAGIVQQYILAYDTEPFGPSSWDSLKQLTVPVAPAAAGTEQVATVRLPVEGGLYYMALRAKDDASLLGPMSNVTFVTVGEPDFNLLPAAPTDIRAVDAPGDAGAVVNISWTTSHDDGGGKGTVEGYNVYRTEPGLPAPEHLVTLPAGSGGWSDPGAVPGLVYTYHVSAADSVHQSLGTENSAMSAVNLGVPPGDFTSDGVVGVDDLSHLVDHYGLVGQDPEFDPLFDMSEDAEIYTSDVEQLAANFGMGGLPADDPDATNMDASVQFVLLQPADDIWHVLLTVEGANDLGGYSFRVTYHGDTAVLLDAGPGEGGGEPAFLEMNGGERPVFMVAAQEPGVVHIAEVIQDPSDWTAPDGAGILAHLTFASEGSPGITVDDVVLMDRRKWLNIKGRPSAVDNRVPARTVLYANFPNPFNPNTTLRFATAERGQVELKIYDLRGRLVRELVHETLQAGLHEFVWNGRTNRGEPVASGVYLYRLAIGDFVEARRMTLVK